MPRYGQTSRSAFTALPVRALRPAFLAEACRAVGVVCFRERSSADSETPLSLPVAEAVAIEFRGASGLRVFIGVVVHHRYHPDIIVGPEGADVVRAIAPFEEDQVTGVRPDN